MTTCFQTLIDNPDPALAAEARGEARLDGLAAAVTDPGHDPGRDLPALARRLRACIADAPEVPHATAAHAAALVAAELASAALRAGDLDDADVDNLAALTALTARLQAGGPHAVLSADPLGLFVQAAAGAFFPDAGPQAAAPGAGGPDADTP